MSRRMIRLLYRCDLAEGMPPNGCNSAEKQPDSGPRCLSPISVRPVWSTVSPMPGNDVQHGVVDGSVRREDVAAARRKRRAVHRRDPAARFGDDERSAGNVPRFQIALPEPIEATRGDIAEIDRRGAQPADGARTPDEFAEQPHDLGD